MPVETHVKRMVDSFAAPEVPSDVERESMWKCGMCDKLVARSSIACLGCLNWMHWKCVSINSIAEAEAEAVSKTFKCPKCVKRSLSFLQTNYGFN